MFTKQKEELSEYQRQTLHTIATEFHTAYTVHRATLARLEKAGLVVRGNKHQGFQILSKEKGKDVLKNN